jgi:RNA 2',3'-cyclic 3'-phosphodiesterase
MRLFFAIEIPDDIRKKFLAISKDLEKLGLDAYIVKEEQYHLTLLFIGNRDEKALRQIIWQAKQAKFRKFYIRVASAGVFPNPSHIKIFWIGASAEKRGLLKLHTELSQCLEMEPEEFFREHITLARIRSKKHADKLIRYKEKLEQEIFGDFVVDHFVLMKSDLLPTGSKYTVLERFELE